VHGVHHHVSLDGTKPLGEGYLSPHRFRVVLLGPSLARTIGVRLVDPRVIIRDS
jgi:hypothetical protein